MKVVPFETVVKGAFERLNSESEINMDRFGQQENDETYDQQSQQFEKSNADYCDADFSEIENQPKCADATCRQTQLSSDLSMRNNGKFLMYYTNGRKVL